MTVPMFLVVAAGFAAAVIVNFVLLPGNHIVSSLYLIPVLIACHRWRAPAVAVTAVLAIGLYIVSAQLEQRPTSVWAFGVLALAMGGYLAVRYAVHIEEIARLLRHERGGRKRLQIFVGMVGHDLEEAMTSVGSGMEMLDRVDRDHGSGEGRVARNAISGGILQMERLLVDLRDAASVGSDGFVLHPGSMDIVETVRQAINQQQLMSPGHRLTLDAPDRVVGVWDRVRVGQLIGNLVSNACKYSPENKDVQVDVRLAPDAVTISVRDRGIGLDARDRSLIFQPLAHIGERDGIPGSGLGLWIAKAIVDAHGGRIWVDSAVGAGSTFTLTLPLMPPSGTSVKLPDPPPKRPAAPVKGLAGNNHWMNPHRPHSSES